jgi:hypothetical protein
MDAIEVADAEPNSWRGAALAGLARLHDAFAADLLRTATRRRTLAGADPDTRAERIGTSFLDLRAALGSFLDIFRVLLRQGWLESTVKKKPWTPVRRNGEKAVASFRRRLRRLGLLLPRGPQAVRLGLAFTGEIPNGWVPVATRLAQQKARAKERAKLRRELAKQKAAAAKAA